MLISKRLEYIVILTVFEMMKSVTKPKTITAAMPMYVTSVFSLVSFLAISLRLLI